MSALRYLLTSNFPQRPSGAIARFLHSAHVVGPVAWMAPAADGARFAAASVAFAEDGLGPLVDVSGTEVFAVEPGIRAVYLSGGDPLTFRRRLLETGMDVWLRSNASSASPLPVIAASGGAMQLTANLSLFRLLTHPLHSVLDERPEFAGLGVVSCEVIPHADRQPESLLTAAKHYAAQVGHSIWSLPDGCAVAYLSSNEVVPVGAAYEI